MKNKIAPWAAALFCAISIHILIIEVSDSQHWFDIEPLTSNFELFLLPSAELTTKPQEQEQEQEKSPAFSHEEVTQTPLETQQTEQQAEPPIMPSKELNGKQLSEQVDSFSANTLERNLPIQSELAPNESNSDLATENLFESETGHLKSSDNQLSTDKPSLLDLSKISLSPDSNDNALEGVFSEELRDKIAESKKAQKDYLKGQVKEIDYPITKDSDGTRYVNIKGVCWRIPEPGSKEPWAIVFAGCGGQTKSFHFELNITPSTLLGPDSPFSISH